jgi:hypothetical protein
MKAAAAEGRRWGSNSSTAQRARWARTSPAERTEIVRKGHRNRGGAIADALPIELLD